MDITVFLRVLLGKLPSNDQVAKTTHFGHKMLNAGEALLIFFLEIEGKSCIFSRFNERKRVWFD